MQEPNKITVILGEVFLAAIREAVCEESDSEPGPSRKRSVAHGAGSRPDALHLTRLALSQCTEAPLSSPAGTQDASILPAWDRKVD